MRFTCPSCLEVLSSDYLEWQCQCSNGPAHSAFRPRKDQKEQKELLEQGVSCPKQSCSNHLVQLQAKGCPKRLPVAIASTEIWCGNIAVIGMGKNAQRSANRAAGALVWGLLFHSPGSKAQWVFANSLSRSACEEHGKLREGSFHFDNDVAGFHLVHPTRKFAATLFIAVRSIDGRPGIEGWFKYPDCALSKKRNTASWLLSADALVFAIEAGELRSAGDRETARQHAEIMAQAISPPKRRARTKSPPRRRFVLLLDNQREFMNSLTPRGSSGTAQALGSGARLSLAAANGYVYENLRLKELWEPLIEKTGGTFEPLYSASPIEDDADFGMEPWLKFISQATQNTK